MKCYKVIRAGGDPRFCFPSVDKNSLWLKENLYCHEYKESHELPIPYIVENNYEPIDYLVAHNNIVSKKTQVL